MTALSESFSLTIICDVFSLLISTSLLFSQIGKPILDNASERDLADPGIVPASMLLGKKHPTANIQPTSQKQAHPTKVDNQMSPANVTTPLFLANPEEISYQHGNKDQPRESPQYLPSSSICIRLSAC